MIVVEANEDADHGQFCSWPCLVAWATEKAMKAETPTEWEPPKVGDDPHLNERERFGA